MFKLTLRELFLLRHGPLQVTPTVEPASHRRQAAKVSVGAPPTA
jgi:hypothetical protein